MASRRLMSLRNLICLIVVSVITSSAAIAMPVNFGGTWVEVDYGAGAGSNETIVIIDWNQTNGPYTTESHAWGFRWDDIAYLSDALAAIDSAGALDITTLYGGDFVGDAFYYDALIDGDNHTSAGFTGWWWAGDTIDGGISWIGNEGGITSEILAHGKIEGFNLVQNYEEWLVGSSTLTIPVPEPCVLTLLGLGGLLIRKRKE